VSEPGKIRAFVALRLSAEVERELARLIESLRHTRVSWVSVANLHLTLRFLGGAIYTSLIPPLDSALSQIAARTAPFTIVVRGTGGFPNLDRPRVVWAGLFSEDLLRLAEQIEAAAVRCGFPAETRPYSPHLTLGRVREQRDWKAAGSLLTEASKREFGSVRIAEMILYRSILGRGGARYEELGRYPFSPT
jgi:RNA 2',3'-cyclic 3'-phosphodiesterase